MVDRRFSETDLRSMMENAVSLRADIEPGRWVIGARHESAPWEVIVEPDTADRLLVVVTAYPTDER